MKVNTRRLYDTDMVYFTKLNKYDFYWTYYEKATKLIHLNVRTLNLFFVICNKICIAMKTFYGHSFCPHFALAFGIALTTKV